MKTYLFKINTSQNQIISTWSKFYELDEYMDKVRDSKCIPEDAPMYINKEIIKLIAEYCRDNYTNYRKYTHHSYPKCYRATKDTWRKAMVTFESILKKVDFNKEEIWYRREL